MSEKIDSAEVKASAGELEEARGLLEEEKRRNKECLTRLKYLQADFENYRKRTDKELKDASDSSVSGLVSTLLGALDELELAVKNGEEGGAPAALTDGLKMVRKNLMSSLEAAGLSRIQAVGRAFDPSLHNAVEREQGSSPGEDTVTEELRPGYTFRGRVLRPSMVKVELALKPTREQEENGSE